MNDNLYWHDLVSRASRFIFTRFSVLARLTIALVALAIGSHSEGAPQTAMGGEAASPDRIATSVNVEQFLLAEIRDDERRNQITAVRDKIFALQSTLVRLASGLPVQFVVEYSTVDLPNPLPDQYDSDRAVSSDAAKVEKRLDVLERLKAHSQLARTRAEASIASASRLDAFKSGYSPALPLGVSLIRSHMTSPTATYEISSVNGLFELARNVEVTLVRQVFETMYLGSSSPSLVRQDLLGSVNTLGNGKSVVVIEPKGIASAQASEFGDCSAERPTHCNLVTPNLGSTYFPSIDLDHATNVAAITAIMAPAAKIISVELTLTWHLDDILDWVASNSTTYNIVAINMSYCTAITAANGKAVCATDAFPANQKFVSLRALGVLPVAGSGNLGWLDKLTHPASDPAVLAVAATYTAEYSGLEQTYLPPEFAECIELILTDKATCFSNMTSKVAVFAPGHYITAGGVTSTGTSQAAPHVSGAVAALSSLYSSETITQIEQRIVNRGPNVTKNGITRKRLDLFAAASNDVTISSSFNGSFSPNVVIAANVYGREKPEDAQLVGQGPWNVSTTVAGSLVRWYALNVPVTFTAPASDPAGGSFVRWDGGCIGTSATNRTCTISSVESSKGIVAVYVSPVAPPTGTTYQISVSKSGAGTVVSSGGAISCGTTCTATIAASSALSHCDRRIWQRFYRVGELSLAQPQRLFV